MSVMPLPCGILPGKAQLTEVRGTCPGKAGGVRIWFQVEIFGVREKGPGLGMQLYGGVSPSSEAEQGSLQLGAWGSSAGRGGRWHVTGWPGYLWLVSVHFNK